ncbi:RNA pyrophosphohydrolase [Roseinatronobacter bogoriensis]|uniref:RNA pyrophosphohydrolase n=1 Tax=Roseinatronobacter bogoriensis subsp. barguzinensis TaxID=441209 RepID=A0A2K8K7K2_9RHOB|nr:MULTISPECIES: RNA pyrophosphohydrolase [Rhodobaca]ATX65442.1 RNA pyrophosphohydrolase [Rhodobaca barguzinensis]MBB4209032.1 putative (di)nucleoside polyphosphate hydrolase [Rhodobaca bogoriensis DSM 18756]TDW37543.1 putative (di)nucleoside polyphosphate hydrolase [Rhodobaca barguzinensis]TDY68153.1 putative (di)nucleoside polyphosphate hydrolase [Rhodobaca bogoriensis DSM 18756]
MTPAQIEKLPYRPCVGIVLINAQGLIFAAQRIDSPTPAWQMPQGGIDAGENPGVAALRELQEEISVTPDLVAPLSETRDWLAYDLPHEIVPNIWNGCYKGQQQRWFLMRYLGRDDQINIQTAHPEFSEWRWIAADAMLHAIVPFKRQIYQQVIDEFRDWLA